MPNGQFCAFAFIPFLLHSNHRMTTKRVTLMIPAHPASPSKIRLQYLRPLKHSIGFSVFGELLLLLISACTSPVFQRIGKCRPLPGKRDFDGSRRRGVGRCAAVYRKGTNTADTGGTVERTGNVL